MWYLAKEAEGHRITRRRIKDQEREARTKGGHESAGKEEGRKEGRPEEGGKEVRQEEVTAVTKIREGNSSRIALHGPGKARAVPIFFGRDVEAAVRRAPDEVGEACAPRPSR